MGDKQPKCFVPDCNNSVGVLFPKAPELKKKWLKALQLEHVLQPDLKSFVCLDHFEEDGQPAIKKNASLKVEGYAAGYIHLPAQQKLDPVVSKSQSLNEDSSTSQSQKKAQEKFCDLETDDPQGSNENEDEYTTIYSRYEKMCRLCMVRSSNVTTSLFNKLDEKHTIAQAIRVCLYPLQVLPNDNLSNSICTKCIKSLRDFLKFHQTCLANDAKQRELLLLEPHSPNYYDSDEYLHEERLSDYEGDKENQEAFRSDNSNGQIVKRSAESDNICNVEKNSSVKAENRPSVAAKKKYDEGKEELLKVLEGNEDVVLTKVDKSKLKEILSPAITSKNEDVVLLTKVEKPNSKEISPPAVTRTSVSESNDEFHYDFANDDRDNVTKVKKDEDVYTENIIIQMVNDESSPPAASSSTPFVDTSKLPITIKRVENTPFRKKGSKRKLSNANNLQAKRNMTIVRPESNEEIVILPSGISVVKNGSYTSPLGQFKSERIKYVFNSLYLLAGGYLYEFGLIKDDIKRLRCIVSKCPATAYQSRLRHNEYSEDIEVTAAHNHQMPDMLERKRQMFYHILYGKMRRDKNFNFKALYDQFCQLDPNLGDILPLRTVIKEICKQGPKPAPPQLNTFSEFYNFIEHDAFHKIHFTDNRVQFYQDRFESDDGAKAVVFGSRAVIDSYSSSKLMYVDASFVIGTTDFPYQLVTVLVWVEESYYPILYAFVNMKSQEIYKKIFGFLYKNLAPSLRPHEIITDYEANLYYALGETYVDSSIGGAMFYFTQNIYKKICALGLARELELNSNFRSIFNMLLMLPLLPVNTILDGLNNIEVQARQLELQRLTDQLFVHVNKEWICKVTPELFCVHRLENRINENIVAPFKKLRDLLMLSKSKTSKNPTASTITVTIEKLIDLERFLRDTYSTSPKKSFAKDLSSFQKKIILKAWNYIENHPMININQFFLNVLGYIKCMENQLWIWGFYRYGGIGQDTLIDANNFSIVNESNEELLEFQEQLEDELLEEGMEGQNNHRRESEGDQHEIIEEYYIEDGGAIRKIATRRQSSSYIQNLTDEADAVEEEGMEQYPEKGTTIVMEAVIDENGECVLQDASKRGVSRSQNSTTLNYVYK